MLMGVAISMLAFSRVRFRPLQARAGYRSYFIPAILRDADTTSLNFTVGKQEITFQLLFSTVVEFRTNSKRRLHSTPLLLEHRVHPARRENARRGPEAQIVHVLGDVEPSVHHACRNDDDVAGLHDFFHDFV